MIGYRNKYETTGKVRAQWIGKLGNNDVYVYVAGGKAYNKGTEIGTLTDDITTIFEFNQKLYFLNGHEYKSWDGTTFGNVEGYIPLVKIATTPQGVGTDYESINVLTGKKHQTFSADGTETVFHLVETGITSVDKVIQNGTEITTGYTVSTTNGTVTFTTAPGQGVDNIDIYWTKGAGDRSLVTANKYATKYGLADDTRVFLYGDSTNKNRVRFSALANGVPSVEYFTGTDTLDIGSSNVAVTDISRQYDRLIISKENETYYATYDSITDSTGTPIITFPTYPLNSSHGMIAPAQGQLLDNYVTTIDSSIIMWTNTQSKDERNAQIISERIQEWLNDKDLSKAITMDYQELKEYWLAIDKEIMIYNYGNSTFYMLQIPEKITSLINYEGTIYFGSESGIYEFRDDETTYDGKKIHSEWQAGFYDFEVEYKRKTMRILWIALKPWAKTSLVVNYVSDRETGTDEKEIENRCFSFINMNFADFTFNTDYNIKPFRIKLKAKKFAYLKLILTNDKVDEQLTINSIAIQKAYGGNVK